MRPLLTCNRCYAYCQYVVTPRRTEHFNHNAPKDRDRSSLDETAILALCCDAAMVATTIHVQDFGDVVGDRAIGRRTLPITHPNFARLSVPVLLIAWSVGLGYIWNLDCYTNLFLLGVATTTSFRFLWLRKTTQDKTSYGYWYNVRGLRLLFAW